MTENFLMAALPVIVCLVGLSALVLAEWFDSAWARAAGKLTASSGFVWAAIAWGALESPYGQWMLAGLVLCWLGDALLLPAGQTVWFQLGIGSFLLGHVAYAAAFVGLGVDPAASGAAVAGVAAAAWWTLRWLRPHVPADFRWPVGVYVAVIGTMVVTALGAVGAGAPAPVAVGAVGFALSDLSVARDRFVSAGFSNTAWGLPLYYLAQLTLAYSVSFVGA